MTETAIDSHVPMVSRTISAFAKIHPAIIAATAALGAYQTAPLLVDYFKPSRPLYLRTPDIRPLALPVVKPAVKPTPEPMTEPVQKQETPPAPPPVVRQEREEPPAAPIVVVPTLRMVAPVAPRAMIHAPNIRRPFIRVRPPRLSIARGLSGFRGMIRLSHVVQMLHFVRRFHR